LLENLREIDIAARYGGDEFVIILPQTPKKEAVSIAERIRKKVEKFPFENEAILPGKKLTISLGVATFPEDAEDKDKLINLADKVLYQVKQSGRNKVLMSA
jgi:diguanylate cyclase (GGDEF)-like protein